MTEILDKLGITLEHLFKMPLGEAIAFLYENGLRFHVDYLATSTQNNELITAIELYPLLPPHVEMANIANTDWWKTELSTYANNANYPGGVSTRVAANVAMSFINLVQFMVENKQAKTTESDDDEQTN